MRKLTFQEIETMFREMGLGTQKERKRFLIMREPETLPKEGGQQLFIRLEISTLSRQEVADAELA